MSTLIGEQESRLIESERELYSFFQQFAKPATEQLVGIECEFFGIDSLTGKALPYGGRRGIEAILSRLATQFRYEPVTEGGHIIALRHADTWVTLEPGGQVELSAAPVRTVFEIEKQVQSFAAELREVKKYFPGITWLSVGAHPFARLNEIPWVPKRRYQLMAGYLKSRGLMSHDMMKRTCTNQVNLDFSDEATAISQFCVVFAITSIVSAMFAHSCFTEGRPDGFLDRRVEIWRHTDPERSGLLLDFLKDGKSFRDYVEYLLQMPMIFIIRGERWIPMEGISFRKFLKEGKDRYHATWSDFELHLSLAFPEARFKHYMEIRGMDAQRLPLIPSVAAFWKGILYDEAIRQKVRALVQDFSAAEIMKLHQEIPYQGLSASLAKTPILEIARQLYYLSCEGLGHQRAQSPVSECVFLQKMYDEILAPGRSPAETLLMKWEGEFGRDPQKLIQYLEL